MRKYALVVIRSGGSWHVVRRNLATDRNEDSVYSAQTYQDAIAWTASPVAGAYRQAESAPSRTLWGMAV